MPKDGRRHPSGHSDFPATHELKGHLLSPLVLASVHLPKVVPADAYGRIIRTQGQMLY